MEKSLFPLIGSGTASKSSGRAHQQQYQLLQQQQQHAQPVISESARSTPTPPSLGNTLLMNSTSTPQTLDDVRERENIP